MASCTRLKIKYDKLIASITALEVIYAQAIETADVVQHSFGSSEGSTSSTMRNPRQIREEIEELERQADQLEQRCRQKGVTTMAFRRNIGGGRI